MPSLRFALAAIHPLPICFGAWHGAVGQSHIFRLGTQQPVVPPLLQDVRAPANYPAACKQDIQDTAIVFARSEFFGNSTQDHRPWIFRFAATLPKAVYFAFTSQHLRNKIVRPARFSHLFSILQNTLVCSPMPSYGERSSGGGYRGIGIRKRRGRNARGKAGSVKLVLRVDNKEFVHDDNVLRLRFRITSQLRKHPVRVRGVTARKRCWLTFPMRLKRA